MIASPLRRLRHDPATILTPFVKKGMRVLEPGPGMGFFTLELARLVGPAGKVIAVDVQPKMISALLRRARKAGLQDRIDTRTVRAESMDLEDLDGTIDFALAFAMIHELPDNHPFLGEVWRALKPGGRMLVAEPRGHVKEVEFSLLQETARRAGFKVSAGPDIRSCRAAIFMRD